MVSLQEMKDHQQHNSKLNEYSFAALLQALTDPDKEIKEPNRSAIKKVHMIPKNVNVCKIYSDSKHVYAAVNFYEGDIVEMCPSQLVTKSALYDNNVRKMVFEVDKDNTYVIPFGYCQYYDLSDEYKTPNVDYIWDPNINTIVIKALRKIKAGDILVLNA